MGYDVPEVTTAQTLEVASGVLSILGFAFAPFKALSVAIGFLSGATAVSQSVITKDMAPGAGYAAGAYGKAMVQTKASFPTAVRVGIILGNVSIVPSRVGP